MKIDEVEPMSVIQITCVVIDRDGSGNVTVQMPGVGQDGGWSIVKSAEVDVLVPASQFRKAWNYRKSRKKCVDTVASPLVRSAG